MQQTKHGLGRRVARTSSTFLDMAYLTAETNYVISLPSSLARPLLRAGDLTNAPDLAIVQSLDDLASLDDGGPGARLVSQPGEARARVSLALQRSLCGRSGCTAKHSFGSLSAMATESELHAVV